MRYDGTVVFVTGGAGFIGSAVIRHFLDHTGAFVVNIDKLTYASNRCSIPQAAGHPRYAFAELDICNENGLRALFECYRPAAVMNLAAESHVDRSIDGPGEFIQTNIVGTFTLLQESLHYWRSLMSARSEAFRFLHVSTDEVYGSLGASGLFTEATAYAPNSPYSASKASSDHLVRAYHETYGLDTTVTNCSNNYGPYQFPEKLIPLTIVNILLGKPLPVYGDGLQVRDWLHVEDHCAAITLALRSGRPGEVYNVGGNSETTNMEIVRTLCGLVDEALGARAELRAAFPNSPAVQAMPSVGLITHVRDRLGHDRRYAIDYAKAAAELGYAPARDLAMGLRATLDWYLANTRWWQALLGRDYADWLEKNYKR